MHLKLHPLLVKMVAHEQAAGYNASTFSSICGSGQNSENVVQ